MPAPDDGVVTPRIDDRVYRHAQLSNGLRVLVVSDARADKAAAALSVFRGSLDDTIPGIAHFLEHMLFLGTDRFPDADEYHEFIGRHGGTDNAYTAPDHTNYFFDIHPDWFEPALERFSRFFVAPTLDPQWVDRERHAVHSEFQLQKKEDGWRGQAVRRVLFDAAHPARRFSIGNLDTLQDQPDQTLQQALINFYEANYSADQMALVLIGPQSARDLLQLASNLFNEVPDRGIGPAQRPGELFNTRALPALLTWRPEKDTRSVAFRFPVPPAHPHWRLRPLDYLGNLLGHEGDGSLHALLKERGWIDSLAAGHADLSPGLDWFEVSMQLTPEGLRHIPEIGTTLFQTIGLVQRDGLAQWRQQENARLSDLAFNYQEQVSPTRYAYYLAGNLVRYPTVDVLRAPYAADGWDAALVGSFLDHLVPANVIVELVHPNAPADAFTPWFEVPYQLKHIPEGWLERWQDPGYSDELALPNINPFVPETLELIDPPSEAHPARLVNARSTQLWHGSDVSFRVPRATLITKLKSASGAESPADLAARTLYASLVTEALNSWSYPALLAGLSYQLGPHAQGFQLTISGYSERQTLLLDRVLTEFEDHEVDSERFRIRRTELARQWRNRALDRPYQQVSAAGGRLVQTRTWDPHVLAQAAERLTETSLETWRRRFMSQVSATTLVWGNFDADTARAINNRIDQALGDAEPNASLPRSTLVLPDARNMRILDVDHDDAAMSLYVQGRTDSVSERAAYGLLAAMIRPAYFNALRTEQKLGYVVSASPRVLKRTPGLSFLVQSPSAPVRALVDATTAFMGDWCAALPSMGDDELEQHRAGLLARVNERDKNLAGRAVRLWRDLETGFTTFDSREQLSEAIELVTLDDLLTTCTTVTADLTERSVLVGSEGRFRGAAALPPGTLVDMATFKRDLARFPSGDLPPEGR